MKLQASTGSSEADKIIADVVSSFATAMAGKVRGFYVAGSYAEGTPVPASDIDLIAVLAQNSDEELARSVAEACIARSPIRLDLVALTAEALADRFIPLVPAFKMGTLLVAGEDMREELPLPPLGTYGAAWANRARRFMARIRRVETVHSPLGYPDPSGEFFGYDRATIVEWYPPNITRSTKELVAIVGSAATSLVALRGGAYVPTKGSCAPLYAEHIGDEWTGLVSEVHALCRGRLRYGIPKTSDERRELRAICAKVLAFEQHALLDFDSAADRDEPELTIRPATPADASAIAVVHIRSWQVGYRGQLPDAFLDELGADLQRRTAFWKRWLTAEASSRAQTALVADEGGRIVGFVTFGPSEDEPLSPRAGQVYALYVDPTHWRRGYGRALFTAAVRGLRNAGFNDAVLWVLDTNNHARRFYEIAGWKADGGIKAEERGQAVLNEVRYRRVLDD